MAGGLAALVLASQHEVPLGGRTFALRDHLVYTVPVRSVLHQALRAGRFPEWWPEVGLGTPFAANPAHQAFSPVAWLFSALPMPLGADLEALAWLVMAAVGTALLASRLGAGGPGAFLAGGLAGTSGYLGSLVVNGNLPHVAWVPWIAWSADRIAAAADEPGGSWLAPARAAACAAPLGALQLVGLEPGATVTALLLAVAVVVWRGRRPAAGLAWLGAAGAGALALAACAVIPAVLLGLSSKRGAGLGLLEAGAWSMHPLRLLEWIWPHLLGDPLDGTRHFASLAAFSPAGSPSADPCWSYSLFLGLPAILLAVSGARGPRARGLLVTSGLFLLLALGLHTPAFAALRAIFPPERYLRYPEKHVLGAIVPICAFAGVGLTRLLAGEPSRRQVAAFAAGALGLALLVAGATWVAPALSTEAAARAAAEGLPLDPAGALAVSLRGGVVAVAAATVAAAGAWLARRGSARLGAAAVAAAILATSAWDHRSVQSWVPRSAVAGVPALLAAPVAAGPGQRLFRDSSVAPFELGVRDYARWVHETAAGDAATLLGLGVLPGMNPAQSPAYRDLFARRYGALGLRDLARLLGIRWALWDLRVGPPPVAAPAVAFRDGFATLDLAPVRPRAFVATQALRADALSGLRALSGSGPARPEGLVVVEGEGPPLLRGDDGAAVPCVLRSPRPERLDLECLAPAPGFAVLLDEWAPGWEAAVDGAPAPLLRADGLFRAVAIGPGEHRVVFRYRAPGLRLGLSVSAAAAVFLAAFAWWPGRARRRAA